MAVGEQASEASFLENDNMKSLLCMEVKESTCVPGGCSVEHGGHLPAMAVGKLKKDLRTLETSLVSSCMVGEVVKHSIPPSSSLFQQGGPTFKSILIHQ